MEIEWYDYHFSHFFCNLLLSLRLTLNVFICHKKHKSLLDIKACKVFLPFQDFMLIVNALELNQVYLKTSPLILVGKVNWSKILEILILYVFEIKKSEACNFIKKRLWHRCFPVNFAEFLRPPIFIEYLQWLLLKCWLVKLLLSSECYLHFQYLWIGFMNSSLHKQS